MPPTKPVTRANIQSTSSTDDDNLEILINKVCTNFMCQLEGKLDEKLGKLENRLTEMSTSITKMDNIVTRNTETLNAVKLNCNVLEQYNRRNTLRFQGIPETEGEVVLDLVITLIRNSLKIPIGEQDVDCAFRVGKHINQQKPRAILVNFITNIKRTQVYGAKKLLKLSKIAIYEDLTPERYELLTAAKKKYGHYKAWSAGGKIYVKHGSENGKIRVDSKDEL